MARGRRELEAFAARWLEANPEPGRGVDNSVEGGDNLGVWPVVEKTPAEIAAMFEGLAADPGVVVFHPVAPVVVAGGPEVDRPHALPCFAVAERACDAMASCLPCPAYAAWRKVVRSPYEVLR